MNRINDLVHLISPPGRVTRTPEAAPNKRAEKGAFDSVFKAEMDKASGIKFSAHARQRLQSRQIDLSPVDMDRIRNATDRAASKGSRESLVLMDDRAFVVSVPNRTVITAMEGRSMKEHVFTNIDSAVLA